MDEPLLSFGAFTIRSPKSKWASNSELDGSSSSSEGFEFEVSLKFFCEYFFRKNRLPGLIVISTPFETRRDALADFPVKMTEFASIFLPTEDASKVTLKSSFIEIEDTSPQQRRLSQKLQLHPTLLTAKKANAEKKNETHNKQINVLRIF